MPPRMEMIFSSLASPQFTDEYQLRAFHFMREIGKVKHTQKQLKEDTMKRSVNVYSRKKKDPGGIQ